MRQFFLLFPTYQESTCAGSWETRFSNTNTGSQPQSWLTPKITFNSCRFLLLPHRWHSSRFFQHYNITALLIISWQFIKDIWSIAAWILFFCGTEKIYWKTDKIMVAATQKRPERAPKIQRAISAIVIF